MTAISIISTATFTAIDFMLHRIRTTLVKAFACTFLFTIQPLSYSSYVCMINFLRGFKEKAQLTSQNLERSTCWNNILRANILGRYRSYYACRSGCHRPISDQGHGSRLLQCVANVTVTVQLIQAEFIFPRNIRDWNYSYSYQLPLNVM